MIALVALFVTLVAEDATPLRAAPRDRAQAQAWLFKGDWLEVRGEEPGWLKVWDHRRERPGYVRPEKVRSYEVDKSSAPALLAVVAFLRDAPGFESLGIGAAALALRCDPQAEVQAAIGAMAERLARRGSPAHREVAEAYGVRFVDVQQEGRVRVCYDGAAFRRVLADAKAPAADRARAALSLTDGECADGTASPLLVKAWNEWRLAVLDGIDVGPERLLALAHVRRAEASSSLAFQAAREGADASTRAAAAERELALADPANLAAEDLPLRAQAALRVAPVRWATEPVVAGIGKQPHLEFRGGRAGETCVSVVAPGAAQVERCTFGVVWRSSAQGRGRTLTLAVQPRDGWTELWIARRVGSRFRIDALPPGNDARGAGYVELAGFTPDGAKLLLVREAIIDGRRQRRFEIRRSRDLRLLSSRGTPPELFSRFSDPTWRSRTLALR